MKFDKKDLLLYAVTDRRWAKDKTLCEQVKEALEGGVSLVQLREKDLSYSEFITEAFEIQKICNEFQIPFIINDNLKVMLDVNADGIHIGQEDMDASVVRKRIGNDKILGVSVQTVEQAMEAEKNGADYLGVGAVFPTGSKDDASDVDLETLKNICEAVRIPVVAIGGIGLHNMKELKGSGIAGIAVISAIFSKKEIKEAAEELKNAVSFLIKS